ncbi:MAG: sigma-54-dependent Fis family transcriptional regulator [Desulfobacterales bacterium]|nr:sigma-54-dependent Fis family transcriptional regulator [Desulfobacterales bacterium]
MPEPSILIVDDDPRTRSALARTLTRGGRRVDGASTGFEGLEKFKKETFDLVIADMNLPEMGGVELMGAVRNISPGAPVIMITGRGAIENAVDAIQNGASDYLLKPIPDEVLEAAVKKACKNGKPYHGGASPDGVERGPGEKRMITRDPALLNLLKLAKNVAPSAATVLIQGRSGVGKEVLAAFIHQNSGRARQPYVAVNCAALPESLAESELFGHEKGAFTGASSRKAGKFEQARGGTIVLDEISEMTPALQAKLLRVLQEKQIDRVGGAKPVSVDCRVIAISNRDLKKAVREGAFREDLYFRINVIPFTIPPLRDRVGDIAPLADHFLEKYSRINGREKPALTDEALSALKAHDWRGNVRELENVMERAILIGDGESIRPGSLLLEESEGGRAGQPLIKAGVTVKEMEEKLIFETLKEVNDNRTRAARMLGISIRTLRNKLTEYKKARGMSEKSPGA